MPLSQTPLNVLYVGTLPPHQGGSAVACSQILLGLASLGHLVRAVAPKAGELETWSDEFAADHPSIQIERFAMPFFEIDPMNPAPRDYRDRQEAQVHRLVSELIVKETPDLLFVGRESYLRNLPRLARRHGVLCVLAVHGAVNTIVNGSYPDRQLGEAFLKEIREPDLVVAPAEHMARMLRTLGLVNVRSIQNAVDVDVFCPGPKSPSLLRELALSKDDIVILHVSNLKMVKRVPDMIESAKRAVEENRKINYVVVGDGPSRLELENYCEARNLKARIRFVGWVPRQRMPDYIRLADIVLMPSESEGLALAYLETQACGRFLLISDIPAAREICDGGKAAMLFRKGDIADMTAKTLLAAHDPGLRARIGQHGRQRVQRCHSMKDAVMAYDKAFRSLVGNRSG